MTGATIELRGGSTVSVPVRAGRLKAGDKVTLGVRPEHLQPAQEGELKGEVTVVERLGGGTFLYTQLADDDGMIVIQADGEIQTRVHEHVAIRINPATCHLFDEQGGAVQRTERHPLADLERDAARKAH